MEDEVLFYIMRCLDKRDIASLISYITPENVNLRYNNGVSPLWMAVDKGDHVLVKHCIDMGAVMDIICYEETLLHHACCKSLQIVKILLDAGVDVNQYIAHPNRYFYGIHHYVLGACIHNVTIGNTVPKVLIDYGADPNLLENAYRTNSDMSFPQYLKNFILMRNRKRSKAIRLIAIHKYKLSKIKRINEQDVNILKLIGKHIWSFRLE